MFDQKQFEVIRQALAECDRCETLKLAGDVPVKYQFTKEFEEKAEGLKRRVAFRMKVTIKRILIAAVIVVLALAATVAIVAGQDGMKVIHFGNNIDRTGGGFITDLPYPNKNERVLDIGAMIIEADLPIPEGYECTYFNPYRSSYSIDYGKDSESVAYGHASLGINIYEVYPDAHIKIEHNGEMLVLETDNGLKVYHYEYVYMTKGDNYVTNIRANDPDIDDSQILEIFDAIDDMLHAPMRTEEEIREEAMFEPNPKVHTGWTEMNDIENYNLDFSDIRYRLLPVPEGYDLVKVEGYVRAKYQKGAEDGWSLISELIIEMVDLTVDPYIHTLYENSGDPITVGDVTLNCKSVPYYGAAVEYVYVSEKYAIVFTAMTSPQYGKEELPTAEELAAIVKAINRYDITTKD